MDIFSFFKFYFYTITRNDKRNKLINNMDMFPILVTPVVLFIIHMMASFVVLYSHPSNMIMTYTMPIWIFIIIFNLAYANSVRDKLYRDERERQYQSKVEADRERRKKAEAERQFRAYKEKVRERIEQERQAKERRERMYDNASKINKNNNSNYRNSLTLMGLNDGASDKEIKSAYKRLAKVHHPDLGGTEKNFIKLKKAYDYLMNK